MIFTSVAGFQNMVPSKMKYGSKNTSTTHTRRSGAGRENSPLDRERDRIPLTLAAVVQYNVGYKKRTDKEGKRE